MRYAAIGIGSNSTRLLVGDISGGKVTPLLRLREGTRLFAGLENGALSEESMLRTANAAARFAQAARDEGAQDIRLIATSAARDAENGGLFCEMVEALCGAPLTIVSGEEEARLSFIGAAGHGFCGMVDIGGGSTELAIGGANFPFVAGSAQMGAIRLLGQFPDLRGEGFAQALAAVREAISPICGSTEEKPRAWYGVGGTMTCLASIDMRLPEFDRDAVEGHALRRSAVEAWARKLAGMTLEERAAIPGMLPHRADIIAHGAIVLLGVMETLGIARIVVTSRTNLDGCLQEIAGARAAEDSVAKVQAYYDAAVEEEWLRLERHYFEFEINKHYLDRYIKPGDRVLDVGGGPGRYSMYLAGRGAEVVLVDLSPGNVAFATEKASELGVQVEAICADARNVDTVAEGEFDAVLLMGPLYHLLAEADRAQAVRACLKKLKPGGVLYAAFISMIGGLIYAARSLPESILYENEDVFYEKIIAGEDFAGQAFTQAYFAEPKSVLPFMAKFPLTKLHLISSEGITAPFNTSLTEQPPEVVAKWLAVSLALCEREDFYNYAEHFLYIGRKEEDTK